MSLSCSKLQHRSGTDPSCEKRWLQIDRDRCSSFCKFLSKHYTSGTRWGQTSCKISICSWFAPFAGPSYRQFKMCLGLLLFGSRQFSFILRKYDKNCFSHLVHTCHTRHSDHQNTNWIKVLWIQIDSFTLLYSYLDTKCRETAMKMIVFILTFYLAIFSKTIKITTSHIFCNKKGTIIKSWTIFRK